MRLSVADIDLPGISDVDGALADVASRAGALAGCQIDHVSLCVESANLHRYTERIRQRWPAAQCSEYRFGDPESGMLISAIEFPEAPVNIVLAAPTGAKGHVAEFLARTGSEGLQHIAFVVTDLRAAMVELAGQGLNFVGGGQDLESAIVEVREGDRWLRQTFTETLSGEFFVELIERNGISGWHPGNMQSLFSLTEDGRN